MMVYVRIEESGQRGLELEGQYAVARFCRHAEKERQRTYGLSDTNKAGKDGNGDLATFADGIGGSSWQVHEGMQTSEGMNE